MVDFDQKKLQELQNDEEYSTKRQKFYESLTTQKTQTSQPEYMELGRHKIIQEKQRQ